MAAIDSIIGRFWLSRKFSMWGQGSRIVAPAYISGGHHIRFGGNCTVGKGAVLTVIDHDGVHNITNSHIAVGNNVYIGHYVNLHSMGRFSIGNGCVLSDYVYISNVAHGFNPEAGLIMQQQLEYKGDIEIADNTFIGFNAKILPGVHLGQWCVVGSGSVVTRSFPDYSMIAGNPARLLRSYNRQTNEWEKVS